MDDSKKLLGERLKIAREKKGLKQNRVAQSLGIHNSTLAKYESGDREVDIDTLKKLAELYEVSVDWLSGRTDDPSPLDKKGKAATDLADLYANIERAFGDFDNLPDDEKQFIRDEIDQMPETLRWKLEEYRKHKQRYLELRKKQ